MSRLSWRERLGRMNQRSLFGPGKAATAAAAAAAPEGLPEDISSAAETRAEAMQRLQVGLFGIGAMVLLVGLASIIGGQADKNEVLAAPEAAPTTEPEPKPAQANPLADAGVVPDIADEPSPAPGPSAPVPPGNAAPRP
ncbi:hypothetical protein [Erythrobacter donghaensis]|uniref:hypothetical protein n=1 Tax=Erythrobacter donghaensis TaxID=267135 RepID=UPI000A398FE1|nr:hypothetical protein [Erythrobacter donghaensis]